VLSAALTIAIVAVAWSVLFGADGISRLLDLQAKRQELGSATVLRMQENAGLREQIAKMREDSRHLEALARRQLGLVRADEIVYRFGSRAGTPPR
jgi:cell division protein FtsB